MSSSGNHVSVCIAVANNIHHGSHDAFEACGSPSLNPSTSILIALLLAEAANHETGSHRDAAERNPDRYSSSSCSFMKSIVTLRVQNIQL